MSYNLIYPNLLQLNKIISVDNFCTIWSHPKTSTQDFISFDQQLPPGGLSALLYPIPMPQGKGANGEWSEGNYTLTPKLFS